MKKLSWMIPVVMAGVVMACSSSSNSGAAQPGVDGGSGAPTPGAPGSTTVDAPAKCRAVVGLYCTRAVTCAGSDAGTVDQQRQECEAAAATTLNCEAATGVGASYDTCVAEMPNIDCAKFGGNDVLPPSCKGVIEAPTKPPPAGPAPGAGKPNIVLGRRSSLGDYDTYLGCICDSTDPDSIASPIGLYGSQSKFSQASIWNRFGPFGSDFSSQSVCNQFASDPPVVVNNGQIVGKLTRNRFAAGAITAPDVVQILNQEVCVQ